LAELSESYPFAAVPWGNGNLQIRPISEYSPGSLVEEWGGPKWV